MSTVNIQQIDALQGLKSLSNKSIDLLLTDPPYDFDEEMKDLFHQEFMRVAKSAIVFSPPENQWLKADQYGFWIKPISTKNTSKRYSRFVEMIHFYGSLKWNHDRHWSQYTNVFTDLVEAETSHPFEKPLSLIKRLILNHSDSNDIVLDPFMGSGTTLVIAKQLGRSAVGYELDPDWYALAEQRLDLCNDKCLAYNWNSKISGCDLHHKVPNCS